MLDRKIDQGTIIYGIRSEKYPLVPCYGIIITARCDIAQKKVPKYYYLVGVDASEWFCSEHGYHLAYSEAAKQKEQNVCKIASELELDGATLLTIPDESLEQVLEHKKAQVLGNRKLERKIENLADAIFQYCETAQKNSSKESRIAAIRKNPKPAIKYLKDIDAGKMHHYYFLPQAAYLENTVKGKGLIIDMLEIGILPISDAERITFPFAPGIYFANLPPWPKAEELKNWDGKSELNTVLERIIEHIRLKSLFWLENESDFVDIEGTILSPWCEHLMQRFSNAFIRIGLDNPGEQDFENVITNCYREEIP